MYTVTIDMDPPKTFVLLKDIVWLDDITFKFPDGDVYRMVVENTKNTCPMCVLNDPTTDAVCGLDTDPRFKYLVCWGGDEGQSQMFYYFQKITDR